MPLDYLPTDGAAFVPRSRGFGARLLGRDPEAARTSAADAIVVARHERDLLRPDLALLGADGSLLPEALACPSPVGGGDGWAAVELPDPATVPAFDAALAAVRALGSDGPVGVLLSGPQRLADAVSGEDAADDEELLDACALAVADAAKAVLAAGGHVVLEEDRAPSASTLELWSPLLRLLAHHRRPALVVLDADEEAARRAEALGAADGVGAVVHGAAAPRWGCGWSTEHGRPVFSPAIEADASPELVQELVRAARRS